MTAPSTHQQPVQAKDAIASRKRRRRAPAGGASDDCFTCIRRNVKCDRRRPYCSQCLEVSNECSGYKTQLTWGVGVASRGKLRGLSLPVAKSPPAVRESGKRPSPRARARSDSSTLSSPSNLGAQVQSRRADRKSAAEPQIQIQIPIPSTQPHVRSHIQHSHQAHAQHADHSHLYGHAHTSTHQSLHWPDGDDLSSVPSTAASRSPIDIPVSSDASAASAPVTPYGAAVPSYDYLSMTHHNGGGSWSSVTYSPDHDARFSDKFPLSLITDGLSSSVSSVGSELDYISPMSHSYPREDVSFVNSTNPGLMYDSYSAHHDSPVPQTPPSAIVPMDRHHHHHHRTRPAPPTSCPSLAYPPSAPSASGHHHHAAADLSAHHLGIFESQMGHQKMMMRDCSTALDVPGVGGRVPGTAGDSLSSRMPFFIDYYTNTLCPGMVLVDGPGNPFRRQIMQLAAESPSLQHAICALSACNLRMRTKLSLGQDPRELSAELRAERKAAADSAAASSDGQDAQALDERTPLSEESEHRNLAIRLLNRQLNDPAKSSDDSTLATILLLSHCRMAESGIAKFHTQFAGVKRIMAIRSSRQMTRREPSWMEAVFAHFDAISASVNDREAQLSVPLAQLAGGDDMLPAGVENLIGCDGELFKTISRLGRLNLLSQHRPVQVRGTAPAEAAPSQAADIHAHGRLDGNGSGSSPDEADVVASATRYAGVYDVRRSAFWKEWKEIREALRRWEFDGETVSANLPEAPTPKQVRDLGSVSEAFRHAALLYTERLSSPMLPSSHSNFQNLVSQVIRYTTSLEAGSSAEKFLLWPLFVAGSECVDELQQSIVRSKCRGMMARSGYMNNLAALQVLEELWATELKGEDARVRTVGRRSPFNWSRYISGGDVEWIMF